MSRLQALLGAGLIAALVLWAAPVGAQPPVPPLTGHVIDQTRTLSDADRSALEHQLSAHEASRGSQVAVLLVATTRPETIEQFALRVAEQWKLGRRTVDDGALLVVATEDRTLRIEVGYGLEGVLSDAISRRIISQVILPRFRENDLSGGIRAGVDAMLSTLRGEPLPPPHAAPVPGGIESWQGLLPLVALPALGLGLVLRRVFGRLRGSLATGLIVGLFGWFFIESLLLVVALALVTAAISFTGLAGLMMGRGGPGGGSSGGGFRGGGGGFGGGGGSGRW